MMELIGFLLIGLFALLGWFLLFAVVAGFNRRIRAYQTITRQLRSERDAAHAQLLLCRAELSLPKPFGEVKGERSFDGRELRTK